jgi:hypothetical protein
MIFENYSWDLSDQPKILKKEDKKNLRKNVKFEFLKISVLNFFYFPYLFLKYLFLKDNNKILKDDKLFYGLCVNLDKGDIQHNLVEELGVKSLQIRVFLSDIKNINSYVEFAKKFGKNKQILINIIQSRKHITNHQLLRKDIKIIFEKFENITDEFMIGNSINRIKWGFVSIKEYLEFFQVVQNIKDENFANIKLIGSSVIDFEYHFTIATVFHKYNIYFDKISALLYVDRRGSPCNKQYKIFNLMEKINFLYTIVKSSKKCSNDIYITETNWPIKNTAPYAPTSEKECISEDEYSKFMVQYFEIAKKSGKIQKVFWHQLVANGYGLVNIKDGKVIKREAFFKYAKMIKNTK